MLNSHNQEQPLFWHQLEKNIWETNLTYSTIELDGFYDISTLVGYLVPNPAYTYIY